jgi:hypothetical protein
VKGPALREDITGYNESTLPSPFQYLNSTGGAVNSISWDCRRAQISSLLQMYELGFIPTSLSSMNASLSSNTLTIGAALGDASISFTASISYPADADGTQQYPAIIALGGPSIPIPSGIAVISFNNNDIAQQNNQSSRGVGKFYDLYGSNATAGAMAAWTWAVSRIIDGLEKLPNNGSIDVTKLGVTGCSRNGKGALVAGAFEHRIALTIPQESGSGGDACWRLSNAEQADGYVVQTSPEIVQENVWFGPVFNGYANGVNALPFDHHILAAMVAPRALLAIENTFYDWLSPRSSYGCMKAAHTVWEAMGVPDHMGFTQDGNHSHCSFPADQQGDLDAFIGKFLLGQETNTAIMKAPDNETSWFNETYWMPWKVPIFYN